MLALRRRAARAAHAVAHLLHGRTLGRIHRSNASALEIQPDYYTRRILPSMRICNSRRTPKADAMIRNRLPPPTAAIVRSTSSILPQRPLCRRVMSGTGGLGRRCRAADEHNPISYGGFPDPLHARSRHGTHWQSRRAKEEIEAMKALRTTLQRADQSYWADRTDEQMLPFGMGPLKEARAIRLCSSCGQPPTAKTVASSTWRWRIASIRSANCWGSCCLRWDSRQPPERVRDCAQADPNRFRAFWGRPRCRKHR